MMAGSPWAQGAEATFPDTRGQATPSVYDLPGAEQAGMKAPKNAATDGHWSGGVSRNTSGGSLPTISVLVRWDSALPVRQAVLRLKDLGGELPLGMDARTALQEPTQYVLTIIGLVPANQYRASEAASKKSSSDDIEGTRPALDLEQVLEGLMANTRLLVRGKPPLRPEDIKLDGPTGVLHVFFPRSLDLKRSDKEVTFRTRFGALTLDKSFRLNDMVYQNRLEL